MTDLEERVAELETVVQQQQATIDEQVERIEDLGATVDELEAENERLQERVAEQAERIEDLEAQPEVEYRDGQDIQDLWIGGLPVGKRTHNNKTGVKQLDNRVTDLERGEVDAGEVVAHSGSEITPEDMLTIHNTYNTVQHIDRSEHQVSKNAELAARAFPYLPKRAYNNAHGELVLPSSKLRDILERDLDHEELPDRWDTRDPNANTVARIIEFVERGMDEIVTDVRTRHGMTEVVLDREEWLEYTDRVADATISLDRDADDTVVSPPRGQA